MIRSLDFTPHSQVLCHLILIDSSEERKPDLWIALDMMISGEQYSKNMLCIMKRIMHEIITFLLNAFLSSTTVPLQ